MAEWRAAEQRWLIAQDVVIETPHWRGRMVVEDVKEDQFTTTYKMKSMDGDPPLGWGLFRAGK